MLIYSTEGVLRMSDSNNTTYQVQVGSVILGGGAPVAVQSMTDTATHDVAATVSQIKQLVVAGSELVRITVDTEAAAEAVPLIRQQLDKDGVTVPLIGDFHYNGHHLLTAFPQCAEALAKYRINPGNVGFGTKKDAQFNAMIAVAIKYNKPVRIGVNWGSLDKTLLASLMDDNAKLATPKDSRVVLQEALVMSALTSAAAARQQGLAEDKIIISCKTSTVKDLIAVYQMLKSQCSFPLHVGLTEAGMGSKGIVASSIGIGTLLQQGIGDTIRVSLTPQPGASRDKEVYVCQDILQSIGLRTFTPVVTSCPGCGRTSSAYFRELTETITYYLREKMPEWRLLYPGSEQLTVAVMGCVVNGPGESKMADIGISLPGNGEAPASPVFIDGKKAMTLRGDNVGQEFIAIIESYVKERFALAITV